MPTNTSHHAVRQLRVPMSPTPAASVRVTGS
jgi:hypothetical protein